MPKSTYGTVIAGCGHEYQGYNEPQLIWPYCRQCMRTMRFKMRAENLARQRLLAERSGNSRSYYIPEHVRRAVYERDRWVCQLCHEDVDPDLKAPDIWSASLDHIICRSWTSEPDHSESNLRLAHRWCNAVRGDESTHSADVLAHPSISRGVARGVTPLEPTERTAG